MSDAAICPCDGLDHPHTITNIAGLPHVRYRVGDFQSFREALLQPLDGEVALTPWRPNQQGDLLLQVMEWWSYVSDVITFYNERSLNNNLLRTADLDESVRRLVRILGYRPRPGIAASGYVAGLLTGPKAVTLPAGFAIDSKPKPGKQAQTFESSDVVAFTQPDAIVAMPPGTLLGTAGQVYLEGTITTVNPGDLLVFDPLPGITGNRVLFSVKSVRTEKDSAGAAYTEITPDSAPALPAGATKSQYRLLRNTRTSGLWKYSTTTNLIATPLELEGVDRGVRAGDFVVLRVPPTTSSLAPVIVPVNATTESVWYANGNGGSAPSSPTVPVGIPHTRLYYSVSVSSTWNTINTHVRVLLDWQSAGTLRDVPVASYTGTPLTLVAQGNAKFRVGAAQVVLIEDADGNGALASGTVTSSKPSELQILSFMGTPPTLKTPLKVLHDVVQVTHGKSVGPEIMGSGDATIPAQSFVLKKSPLTYLPSGDSFKSTLRVYVNRVQWTEVQSFYGQPHDAHVFVTYEDDDQKTHVLFGDGVNGSRLPTGVDNVIAYYRYGSGADAPGAGSLTVISNPQPGLSALRHPVDAGGGADPDPREKIRRYAPKSVLTFGRAISADDYEVVAAQAPGVTRVRSVFGWDANEQRATVTLYVGDDANALQSAKNALKLTADPNRPVSVVAATPVPAAVFIGFRIKPGYLEEDVTKAVRAALTDDETGLFGKHRIQIGERIYFSQISDACLAVDGVDSLMGAFVWLSRVDPVTGAFIVLGPRITAAAGEFFQIEKEWVLLYPEVLTSV